MSSDPSANQEPAPIREPAVVAQSGSLTSLLSDLMAGHDLGRDRAQHMVSSMLAGEASDPQIAGLLMALATKGETTAEILGMRDAMLAAATPLDLPVGAIDIVGVGGAPRRRTAAFNVSTISSVVAAAAGAVVCKHGNRKASSTSGSFDLLEALGADIEISPDRLERCVRQTGLGFAFARAHHPSMRHVGPARAALGVPTVFNVLGPLSHPGRVKRQVLGVGDARRAAQIASVVAESSAEHVWVVHGHDDLDELAVTGPSKVTEIRGDQVTEMVVDPESLGIGLVKDGVAGGDAGTNAKLARSVLSGEPSPNRDVVVLNAGAGLVVAGVVDDLSSGIELAGSAIDDGRAQAKLAELVSFTNA